MCQANRYAGFRCRQRVKRRHYALMPWPLRSISTRPGLKDAGSDSTLLAWLTIHNACLMTLSHRNFSRFCLSTNPTVFYFLSKIFSSKIVISMVYCTSTFRISVVYCTSTFRIAVAMVCQGPSFFLRFHLHINNYLKLPSTTLNAKLHDATYVKR